MVNRRDVHDQIKASQEPVNTETPNESQVEAPPSDAGAVKTEATAEAKPAKVAKAPKVPEDCKCGVPNNGKVDAEGKHKYPGCQGGKTTGKFAPGHDAKLVGYLTREYAAGNRDADSVIAEVREKSGNSALLVGKIKSAVKRADDDKVAKARREQADKDKMVASGTGTDEAAVNQAAEVAAGV